MSAGEDDDWVIDEDDFTTEDSDDTYEKEEPDFPEEEDDEEPELVADEVYNVEKKREPKNNWKEKLERTERLISREREEKEQLSQQASQIVNENQELRQKLQELYNYTQQEKARADKQTTQLTVGQYEARIDALNKEIESEAKEIGELEAEFDPESTKKAAQKRVELFEKVAQRTRLKEIRAQLEYQQQDSSEQVAQPRQEQQQRQQPQQQVQRQQYTPTTAAAAWLQNNSWFDKPQFKAQSEAARVIDKQLHTEGYDKSSHEYFAELNRRLSKVVRVPTKRRQGAQVASGRSQSPASSNNAAGRPPSAYENAILKQMKVGTKYKDDLLKHLRQSMAEDRRAEKQR
jgi:chromosome segregation ATPase